VERYREGEWLRILKMRECEAVKHNYCDDDVCCVNVVRSVIDG